MELDAVYGFRLHQPPLDIKEDGEIDSDDLVTVDIGGVLVTVAPSAVESRAGIIDTPAVVVDGGTTSRSRAARRATSRRCARAARRSPTRLVASIALTE